MLTAEDWKRIREALLAPGDATGGHKDVALLRFRLSGYAFAEYRRSVLDAALASLQQSIQMQIMELDDLEPHEMFLLSLLADFANVELKREGA